MSWGGTIINNVLNAIIPDRLAKLTRKEILAKYGDPSANYLSKYCTLWQIRQEFKWFPAKAIFINKDFMLKLSMAFTQLEAEGLHTEIKTFDGCFNIRNTRGSMLISLHAYAMAMDLNASMEKLGQKTTNFTDRFIEIMTAHVYWGGNFLNRRDPMHFSLYGA